MLSEEIIGWKGAPFELDVERGKIRELANALDVAIPEYMEGDAPLSPPTFLTTMFAWTQGDSDPLAAADWERSKSLHAEQEFVLHRGPPRAGQRLLGQTHVENVYRKQSRTRGTLTFVVLSTTFHDRASGELAAESRGTVVETQNPPAPDGTSSKRSPDREAAEHPSDGGQLPPWRKGPITRTDIVKYEGAAVIFNPIHHDELAARAAGYPTPISVGMYQAGLLGGYAARQLGPAQVRRFGVRFHHPVFPGDVLECTGSTVPGGEGVIGVELACRNQDERVVISGWGEFAD